MSTGRSVRGRLSCRRLPVGFKIGLARLEAPLVRGDLLCLRYFPGIIDRNALYNWLYNRGNLVILDCRFVEYYDQFVIK